MTKLEIYRDLYAVLTTLAEVDGPQIASMVYLALGSDMRRYRG
jgi:hypothetical protein